MTDYFEMFKAFYESLDPGIQHIFLGILGLFVLLIIVQIVEKYVIWRRKLKIKRYMTQLADTSVSMTPEAFLALRRASFGGRGRPQYASRYNFTGVYILYNEDRDMYYVGQAKKVLDRVAGHFEGRGNGHIFADYEHGDHFTIRAIALSNSGFTSIDALERHFIDYYDSFEHGYNRNRGNR